MAKSLRALSQARRKAADAFRDLWRNADEIDLVAPGDGPAEDVASLDKLERGRARQLGGDQR